MPIVALQYSSSTYYNITYNIYLLNNNGDELYILFVILAAMYVWCWNTWLGGLVGAMWTAL